MLAADNLMQGHLSSSSTNLSLTNMSDAKRDLLQRYLSGEINQKPTSPRAINRIAPGNLPEPSFGQERLWFLDQLMPGSPVFNIPIAVRLFSPLSVAVLKQGIDEIIRRHDTLRTTFATVDGQPKVVIAPTLKLTIPVVDLTGYPQHELETEVRRLSDEEALRPFDLAQGPLVRVSLIRLGEDAHVLLVTTHHIISDGWSTVVFFQELSQLYEAFSKGERSPLPELPIQYPDYATWQREWLQGQVLEKQLSYWKENLGGDLPVLDLATDRPRPSVQTHHGARESLLLSQNLTEAITALSQREGVTLFMTLLAAFKVLLFRHTGLQDIIVGSPITSRPQPETEGLIGFFLNNLALRTDLSGNPSFRDVLARVRETALEAYANQDVPFEKIVEELNPDRNLCRTPIFQVFFNLLNFAAQIQLPGLAASDIAYVDAWSQPDNPSSQFDLTLYVAERTDALQLVLLYNADIFNRERIVAMLEQFMHLLEQIINAPEAPISAHSLATGESSSALPDPTILLPEPLNESIPVTFFAKASALAEHRAICRGQQIWTYRDLAQETQSIARSLLNEGLEKGEVVAVSAPSGFGLVASMLGALSSGGVLLTLDRNLPIERQKIMLREAAAKWLLYVGEWRAEDGWMCDVPDLVVIRVREDGLASEGKTIGSRDQAPLDLGGDLGPDDPAYVFFTSGTSGIPKAVIGSHKGLSHFLRWQRDTFQVGPQDRIAQLTGLSFDVVLRDIFLPLTSGASLYFPDARDDTTSGSVFDWLERDKISVIHTVPTLAQKWLGSVSPGVTLAALRWIFFAGEPLTGALAGRWRKALPESGTIVNLYGPTETTLAKYFYVVPHEPSLGVQPLGRPLPETQGLVLNSNNGLCGIGELGEITIRTPFRTLGYRNPTKENEARFFVNPFTRNPNDLVYRTGDLGRYRPDGSLEILGRLDNQIKIRGVRIEPDEITAVLARHPSVKSCIVIPVKDFRGDNSLAAYVVRKTKEDVPTSELQSYLSRYLPLAMVPSAFVMLEELPLTPNGKVDRRALPAPVRGSGVELGKVEAVLNEHPSIRQSVVVAREDRPGERRLVAYVVLSTEVETIISDLRRWVKKHLPDYMLPSAFVVLDELPFTANGRPDWRALPVPDSKQFRENAFVAPRNTLELLLTKTWERVLEVQPIGVKDNFFELGGESLLAVRLFAQIEKVCGKKLPLTTLFQAPTVEQLGRLLSDEKWSPSWSSLVAIQPGGSKPPLFCLHLALGHVLFYRDLAYCLGSDQPVYAFQPQGLDGTQPRHTRIEEMASHYIREMRTLQPEGPYYLGGSSFGGLMAFEMAQQLHAQGQEVGLLALFDTYAPGFSKLSPEASSLRYQLYRFMQRVNLHLGNLLLLEPEGKVKYAREKVVLVKRRLKGSIKQGIEGEIKKIADKLSRSNGHPVRGDSQQRIDVLQALRGYVPQVYPGRVTLFRASKRLAGYNNDPDLSWGELAAGGVEVHEIPGYHGSIVMEPRVRILAEQLQACLSKSQASTVVNQ
jgi:amino acid adenylation domain-containing protein